MALNANDRAAFANPASLPTTKLICIAKAAWNFYQCFERANNNDGKIDCALQLATAIEGCLTGR